MLYDMTFTDGQRRALALRFDGSGAAEPFEPPPRTPLIPKACRAVAAKSASVTTGPEHSACLLASSGV
ncbi:MAG: hypothetical protein C1943_11245 [Halochromatium sp.]|nr:hypothetical protein [Halochromatium sp.]